MQGSGGRAAMDRPALLRENAPGYAAVALANIAREFPADVWHTVRGPEDLPRRPRERTPVFYGSFDWHSCVEMHWYCATVATRTGAWTHDQHWLHPAKSPGRP